VSISTNWRCTSRRSCEKYFAALEENIGDAFEENIGDAFEENIGDAFEENIG